MNKLVILMIMIAIKSDGQHDLFKLFMKSDDQDKLSNPLNKSDDHEDLINLALGKKVYLSSLGNGCEAIYAVDGNVGRFLQACAGESQIDQWLTVDLGRPYQIYYLGIFSHPEMTNNLEGLLHHFHNITPKQRMFHKKTCKLVDENLYNMYNTKETKIGKFQCNDKEEYYRYVTVHRTSIFLKGFMMYELQVFGKYIEYTGCYEEIVDKVTESQIGHVAICLQNCKKQGNLYAALKNGTMCFCGDDIKGSQPLSKCDIFCDNAIDYCGGQNQYSVYFVFPYRPLSRTNREYLGCYTHGIRPEDIRHQTESHLLNVDLCHENCSLQNRNFFGLQDGVKCNCDIKYGYYYPAEEMKCYMPCVNTKLQTCRSTRLDSLYSIKVKVGGFNFRRCKNGEKPDVYDICNECDDGWTGESCSIRDCSKHNGDCKNHKCVSALVYRQNVSECVCNNGFSKLSWSEDCQDIDECSETSFCKFDGARCHNTIGSYNCICLKDGMKYNFTTETCDDVDECDIAFLCNLEVTQCYNTIGSYSCICLEDGMEYDIITETCNDVNECAFLNTFCNSDDVGCLNTIGSYECICLQDGMIFDSTKKKCRDIDECTENTFICNPRVAKCSNVIGSFSCTCLNVGMRYNMTTKTCNDINECADNHDLCNSEVARCSNTIGAYKCICFEDGMVYDSNSKTCHVPFKAISEIKIGIFIPILVVIVVILFIVLLSVTGRPKSYLETKPSEEM